MPRARKAVKVDFESMHDGMLLNHEKEAHLLTAKECRKLHKVIKKRLGIKIPFYLRYRTVNYLQVIAIIISLVALVVALYAQYRVDTHHHDYEYLHHGMSEDLCQETQ